MNKRRLLLLRSSPFAIAVVAAIPFALASADALAAPTPKKALALPAKIKPTDQVRLKNGKTIQGKVLLDYVNGLQAFAESKGISHQNGKSETVTIDLNPGSAAKVAASVKAFEADLAVRRVAEKAGWKSIIKKNAKKGGGPGVKEPQNEPLSASWGKTLGDQDVAALYGTVGFENSGDSKKVGCGGSLDGGIYVLGKQASLVKFSASASASSGSATASASLKLFGKDVIWQESKTFSTKNISKAFDATVVTATYPLIPGVISASLKAGASGEIGIDSIYLTGTTGSGFGCKAGATPRTSAKVTGAAEFEVAGFGNASLGSAGVSGSVTVMDLSIPTTASIALKTSPLSLEETLTSTLGLSYLAGEIDFYVKTDIPLQEKVWDWDVDTYKWKIFGWSGKTASQSLLNLTAQQNQLL